MDIVFLILAFLLTYFIVGFVFIEVFFAKLLPRIKFPLYILTSFLLSTYLCYLTGLIFGLNRLQIYLTLFWFFPLSAPFFYRERRRLKNYLKENYPALMAVVLVVTIYWIALSAGILSKFESYYVLSGSNWQDTAFHLSLTQSFTQGNFPPEAPYFAGAPLSYYYFADFHSAIIGILYDRFFPRVFVYDNALLAGFFFLCIYTLAVEITRNKKLALASSWMGTFFGSYIFVNFLKAITAGKSFKDVISNNNFSQEWQTFWGMANVADNFLQNRPMMIGLCAFALLLVLIYRGWVKQKIIYFVLAGLLSGAMVKFHFFALVGIVISFGFLSLTAFSFKKIKFVFLSYLVFMVPIAVFYVVFGVKSVNGSTFWELVGNTLHFETWAVDKPLRWYFLFFAVNLGIPFILTILSLFMKKLAATRRMALLSMFFVTLPCFVVFTIAENDMVKFFYFAAVIFSIVTPVVLRKLISNKFIFSVLLIFIVFVTTFSSYLTLLNSYINKSTGYSSGEYEAGLWVRQNTPELSVFVTMPSVHCGATDIGGRLRVLSYTTWPFTHGFNSGEDNVFSRNEDMEAVFRTGEISNLKLKYNADYIYYGEEERSQYPETGYFFDNNELLRKVYDTEWVDIYEIL